MRRRAEELGGKYEIESKTGAGTIVTLQIPLEAGQEVLAAD
jgi:signal transduction histidine kinase